MGPLLRLLEPSPATVSRRGGRALPGREPRRRAGDGPVEQPGCPESSSLGTTRGSPEPTCPRSGWSAIPHVVRASRGRRAFRAHAAGHSERMRRRHRSRRHPRLRPRAQPRVLRGGARPARLARAARGDGSRGRHRDRIRPEPGNAVRDPHAHVGSGSGHRHDGHAPRLPRREPRGRARLPRGRCRRGRSRHRRRPGRATEYSEGYYGAFVLDPDSNNVEAVWHDPARLVAAAPLAGRDREAARRPVAPGSRVQPGVVDPCRGQPEQRHARRDAGAAVGDDRARVVERATPAAVRRPGALRAPGTWPATGSTGS